MVKFTKIIWNKNQRRMLREAVRINTKYIKKMMNSGLYDDVPLITSYETEKSRIQTRQELYRRVKELRRIERANAGDVVDFEGVKVPRYLKNEIGYQRRRANRKRKDLRDLIAPERLEVYDWITAITGKNLLDLDEEGYVSGEDLEALISENFTEHSRYNFYLALLQDNFSSSPFYNQIMYIINRMINEYPDKFEELMESNFEEVDIGYIYPQRPVPEINGITRSFTVEGKVYDYKKEAANQSPEILRYGNVENFWLNVGNEYFGLNIPVQRKIDVTDVTYRPRKRRK